MLNTTVLFRYEHDWVPDEKCATKIVKIATIRDYSDRQNIFLLNK